MRSLIYTTIFAVIVIFAFSQGARVPSSTGAAPAPVISQGSLPGAGVPTNRPLPVEQWDAF